MTVPVRKRPTTSNDRRFSFCCCLHVDIEWLETHGGPEPVARQLLTSAGERLHLSARVFHRVLGVARTIADLDGDESA